MTVFAEQHAKRRVRTPTILQQEASECGAACLAIVLAHHGRWVPLEELRVVCGVSRDGSRASNIARAARSYGLDAKGLRIEPDALPSIPLPAIAHWEFRHFVVVEGFDRKGVHLNDPAVGPVKVTWEEFDDAFTGVVVAVEQGDEFEASGEAPSVVAGLKERFTNGHRALLLCLLAGLGLLVPGLLVPAGVRIFVNEYLENGNRHWLWLLVIGLSLAAVAQFAFTWLQQRTLLELSERLSVSMSTRFFEHVLRLPIAFFGQRYGGAIVAKLQSNDQLAGLLSSELAATLLGLLTSLLYLVLMFVYDWQLTLVAIGFAACNLIVLRTGARRRQDVGRKLVADNSRLIGTAVGGLENIETLKATSEEATFFARWAGEHARIVNATQEIGADTARLTSLPFLLDTLNLAAVLGIGGSQVMAGDTSIGTLAAFLLLSAGFAAPLARMIAFGDMLVQVAGTLASVDDVLRHPVDPELVPRRHTAQRLSGALALEDVTFGYSPLEPPLIKGLSLSLEPGQRVAVVGASGSGRSTISRLAVGLVRPWSGRILLDGIPREEIPRGVLAATLAFVDQDIRLFEGTIRDNITLWDPTVADEAVVRAARDAAIHDDIVARPGGYDRVLEEAGRDWSGGQRQRIEIARALAGDPALLVLDEATSALDPVIEYEIDRNLRARGCACLIVAHRLSTIRDSDEILVLHAGTVVERGTHDELMRLGGRYVELVGDE